MERTRNRGRRGPELRTFRAEITFSGLCVLRILRPKTWNREKSRGPRRVEDLQLLFVRTDGDHEHAGHYAHGHEDHEHFPRLTYYAADHLGLCRPSSKWPGNYDYVPSPEGREIVSLDVSEKSVEIVTPYDYPVKRSTLCWRRPLDGKLPTEPRRPDDYCLDWILRDEQVGLKNLDRRMAATTITVPHGRWRTRGVVRNREVARLDPVRWRLVDTRRESPSTPVAGDLPVQAMAGDLVLELKGLRYGLTVRISNRDRADPNRDRADPDPHDIVLTPGIDNCLRLSLTNLPGAPSQPDISHVTMYRDLMQPAPEGLLSPTQVDDVVCLGTLCNDIISFG